MNEKTKTIIIIIIVIIMIILRIITLILITMIVKTIWEYIKLVSAIFYQIFIFSPSDSSLKTMKNAFYFIKKDLFILEIFKFLYFL